MEASAQPVEHLLIEFSSHAGFEGLLDLPAPLLPVPVAPPETQNGHPFGQAVGLLQMVERRQQLDARQVSRGAEDYEGAGFHHYGLSLVSTAWPPNALRIMASTRLP